MYTWVDKEVGILSPKSYPPLKILLQLRTVDLEENLAHLLHALISETRNQKLTEVSFHSQT